MRDRQREWKIFANEDKQRKEKNSLLEGIAMLKNRKKAEIKYKTGTNEVEM